MFFSYLTLAVLVLWLLVFFGLVLFPVSSWLSFFVFCLRSSDVDLCLSFALLRFFWSFPLALAGLAMGFLLVFLFFLFVFSSSSSALTPGDCFASVSYFLLLRPEVCQVSLVCSYLGFLTRGGPICVAMVKVL